MLTLAIHYTYTIENLIIFFNLTILQKLKLSGVEKQFITLYKISV